MIINHKIVILYQIFKEKTHKLLKYIIEILTQSIRKIVLVLWLKIK
jgi:hypothetical protein